MFKIEILYSILLISILILIMVYYKTSVNNLFTKALKMLNNSFSNNQKVESTNNDKCDITNNDNDNDKGDITNTDNLFDTEYEVTEDAGGAISDALKDI
jgi:hypothetical protein